MKNPNSINIYELLNKDSAILPKDGLIVYEKIKDYFETSYSSGVHIDFSGVKYVTTAFLNASIGKFLLQFPEREKDLEYISIQEIDLEFRLNRSIQLALNSEFRNIHNKVAEASFI